VPARPNVLILFTDMQRADTLGALGNPIIRTPNLDRLAAEGTAFTNCFTPSPVCVAARCSLHYGMYPQATRVYDNGPMIDDNGASYAAVLGASGYLTQAIGKCHFTPDPAAPRGFERRLTQEENVSDPERDDYCRFLRDRGYDYVEPQGTRSEMYYIPQVSHLPAAVHPTQWVGDRCLEFLAEACAGSRPWLLFASFIHPHPPFAPPRPWHKLYRAPLMPLPHVPPDAEALHTWVNRHQNRYKYRDQGIDGHLVRLIKAYYYATISFVDYQIGRALRFLESQGQLDRTLILFTSDHGEYLGDYNCFGKRGMHDAAARVPLLVRYPERFAASVRCGAAASLVDVYPTIIRAAGLEPPRSVELGGEDLAELARTPASGRRVYSQFSSGPWGIYMVADQWWKYFYSAADQQEYLFDRRSDPAESRNRAGVLFCQAVKAEMRADLLAFLRRHGEDAAWAEDAGRLTWRRYPSQRGVPADPDAGLLVQDAPGSLAAIPGYSSQ